MNCFDSPNAIADLHDSTAHLPEFERFAERIRLLFMLPHSPFTSVKPLTKAQARSLAFATIPPDMDPYWKVLWDIPAQAAQTCRAAGILEPVDWLNDLCEIFLWARTECVDTTEEGDETHYRPRLIGRTKGQWLKEAF